MAALAGTNLIYGLGMIESGVTFDYAQLVIHDEIARMVKQVVGGIRVSDERLAVDDIARVGAFGDFLSLEATMAHMREQAQPKVIDRRVREDWEQRGGTDMYQRGAALPAAPPACAPPYFASSIHPVEMSVSPFT
jgi:trimethylamine---corrinoid protein Co-methyltransferase